MSTDHFARRGAAELNEARQSLSSLVGIATGLLADQQLTDTEIRYLHNWMTAHEASSYAWPGDIVYSKLKSILADGVITSEERAHLVATLQQLTGSDPSVAEQANQVTELAFSQPVVVTIAGHVFCLTGDFVYAPRHLCEAAIVQRGGIVKTGVSRKLHYLVVGSLGSPEWKHGSFGTKIEKAIELQRAGASILVLTEEAWTGALQ